MAETGGVAQRFASRKCYCLFGGISFLERRYTQSYPPNVSIRKPLLSSRCRPLQRTSYRSLSMEAQVKAQPVVLELSKNKKVPVFVMMPLNMIYVDPEGIPRIRKIKALTASLRAFKLIGVHGIAVEVWWGIVERLSPSKYNWSLYEELFRLISEAGLKMHVALCFHSNQHLASTESWGVSLPLWIIEIGEGNENIYYRDKNGITNADYLTLGVDEIPLFCGRTALQCYEDFMINFVNKFESFIGRTIEEISIGLGPSGELRYPAHPPSGGRWKFPGIGEFQCYDKYM